MICTMYTCVHVYLCIYLCVWWVFHILDIYAKAFLLTTDDILVVSFFFLSRFSEAYNSAWFWKSHFCFQCFHPAAQNCSGLRTCGQCLEQPGCGWCNDPSNTGRGYCIEGSSRGPMKLVGVHNSDVVLDTSLCPKEKNYEWSFIQCPGNKSFLSAWTHGCVTVCIAMIS